MTVKQALKRTEKRLHEGKDGDHEDIIIALSAIEKQFPQKPYDINEVMKTFDCPSCLSSLWAEDELEDCCFCPICGQALDRSGTK